MSLSTSWIRRLVPCLRISYTPSRSCCVQDSSIIRSTSFRLYELYFLIQATVRIVLVIEASWRQRLSFSHFVFHFHSPPSAACAAATIGHGADITEPLPYSRHHGHAPQDLLSSTELPCFTAFMRLVSLQVNDLLPERGIPCCVGAAPSETIRYRPLPQELPPTNRAV